MKKIIIATHHKLAKGFKHTLDYIIPNTVDIIDINAYVENESVENQIIDTLKDFSKEEQIFVFTDLLGGSVNQEFTKLLSEYNIELIAGANLPIIMSVILRLNDNDLAHNDISNLIEESKNQIVYVNDILENQEFDEDDE
ncbi:MULTISPECIES: PTS sugar transporter subunit IIA [Globicatella]|uniref:PTS sugar transporter subunit IIA n=1 Tax=Globicatella TaxID=13075 RepID=UPI0008267E6B|nr:MULTISPECIES: PTS N-acetylglucosamine transporter subunit IIBC [Globicatella]OFK57025.1 PTS N-acetylglucosamine transporter subunit IIBC [Globicatella sp. HMSC072A10]